jgi:prepilin-type N-terminal cleavage/methylation domain-containing protein
MRTKAFSLIELMIVMGIMALVLATGAPAIYKVWHKESMQRTVSDIIEVLTRARAQAIFSGAPSEVIFRPHDGKVEKGGRAPPPSDNPMVDNPEGQPVPPSGGSSSPPSNFSSGDVATIPEGIVLEMLDVNLTEYKDAEMVRVRFYPNGTCDELTIILRSTEGVWRKITLEVTTGLATIETDPNRFKY